MSMSSCLACHSPARNGASKFANGRFIWRLPIRLAVISLAGNMFVGVAAAQPQPGSGAVPACEQMTFTVGEAVACGLVNNPDLRAARQDIGVAEGDVISATLLENPEIEYAVAKEHTREKDKATKAVAKARAKTHSFSISQAFNISGSRPIHVLQTRAALDAARAKVAEAEVELVEQIKHSIAEFTINTHGVPIMHNIVYGVKPMMWDLTTSKTNDRLRAEMAFLDMQQETRHDREELMEVETELNTLLGLPADTRIYIKDTIEPMPIPISYRDLWCTILKRNLNVKAACAELKAARYQLELAMRERVPDLSLGWSRSHTHENTVDAIAHSHEREVALGLTLKLFDQGQGEIHSAIAELKAAGFELQSTELEVGNELYEMYQELNLFRVRLRPYEQGYLARLRKLIEEVEPAQYDAGEIPFSVWEQDLKRFHLDYDEMLNSKIEYKTAMAALERVAGGSLTCPIELPVENTEPPPYTPGSYGEGVALKASQGLGNLALSPVEIPASIYGDICDRGAMGLIVGPFDGLVTFAERAGAGALDFITAPLPWPLDCMKPVTQPICGDPWSGSWSLRYMHPAYSFDHEFFHPSYFGVPMQDDGKTTVTAEEENSTCIDRTVDVGCVDEPRILELGPDPPCNAPCGPRHRVVETFEPPKVVTWSPQDAYDMPGRAKSEGRN